MTNRPELSFEGRRVVLLDLDGTLMDSEQARKAGWRNAVKELLPVLDPVDKETALKACQCIYRLHGKFKKMSGELAIQFPDLRQEWNPRVFYTLVLAWKEMDRLHQETPLRDLESTLNKILDNRNDAERLLRIAVDLTSSEHIDFSYYLDKAQAAFWEADMHLFDGVIELLKTLREAGIDYYIATEGHLPTQWKKITALQLGPQSSESDGDNDWVLSHQLLATSQAAVPTHDLTPFHKVIEWHRRLARAYETAAEVIKGNESPEADYNEVRLNQQNEMQSVRGLVRILRVFERTKIKFSTDRQGNVLPHFFHRVLYAINQAPNRARDSFRQFSRDWNPKDTIRLAMVGDNPRSDMEPILTAAKQLNSKIMAIWITDQSKHGRRYQGKSMEDKKIDWGTERPIEASSIRAVIEILKQDENWDKHTSLIGQAPRFSIIHPGKTEGEQLEDIVSDFLTGLAAVEIELEEVAPRMTTHRPPDKNTLERASAFADEIREALVTDVILSPDREEVIRFLQSLCTDPELGKSRTFQQYKALPRIAIDLLLSIAKGRNNAEYSGQYMACLEKLSSLLVEAGSKKPRKYEPFRPWADALIVRMEGDQSIRDYIGSNETLLVQYLERIKPLGRHQDAHFPAQKAESLYHQLAKYSADKEKTHESPIAQMKSNNE